MAQREVKHNEEMESVSAKLSAQIKKLEIARENAIRVSWIDFLILLIKIFSGPAYDGCPTIYNFVWFTVESIDKTMQLLSNFGLH